MTELSADERAAARRFCETCEDGQEYDVPQAMMRRLEEVGLVIYGGRGRFEQTEELVCLFDAGKLEPKS